MNQKENILKIITKSLLIQSLFKTATDASI